MLPYVVLIRRLGVRLAHDRIHQCGGQLAADSAIDHGQSELECALNEEFLVDHSVEDSASKGIVDRPAQIAIDTSEDSLVVDAPEYSFADPGGRVRGEARWIGSGLEQAEGRKRKPDGSSDQEEPGPASAVGVLIGSEIAQEALLEFTGSGAPGRRA
jgi:hypothetical protein